jgi:peptidoglycan L-alanyl-D-glutamate endopeptidase CwlK
MMAYQLSARSKANLVGVHPDLVAVVNRAIEISTIDFVVTCGLRNIAEQKRLLALGATKTMKSRHLTGHAIDVAALDGKTIRWDWPLYAIIAKAFKQAAAELNIPIEWGGDWTTFKDGPHFQLPHKGYPA